MSLVSQINTTFVRVATEFKAIRAVTGALSNLTTSDKSNLVAAINEIKQATASASGINDATTSGTTAWSSSKTSTAIATEIAKLVNGAPALLDTFAEVAAQLATDETAAAALTTAVGNRLRVDGVAQTISTANQATARTALGVPSTTEVGDVTTDFVTPFVAALTA